MSNKPRQGNPYQPPSFDDFTYLQPQPRDRRSPPLVARGACALSFAIKMKILCLLFALIALTTFTGYADIPAVQFLAVVSEPTYASKEVEFNWRNEIRSLHVLPTPIISDPDIESAEGFAAVEQENIPRQCCMCYAKLCRQFCVSGRSDSIFIPTRAMSPRISMFERRTETANSGWSHPSFWQAIEA